MDERIALKNENAELKKKVILLARKQDRTLSQYKSRIIDYQNIINEAGYKLQAWCDSERLQLVRDTLEIDRAKPEEKIEVDKNER